MSRSTRTPLATRACQAAAQVFAFDRTLAQAFVQLDADVQVERVVHGRRADLRAWLALLRLLVVAVPVTACRRVLELAWTDARVVLIICARLFCAPLGAGAAHALLTAIWPAPPRQPGLDVWSFNLMVTIFAWMLAAQAIERVPGRHRAATVLVMLTAAVGVSLTMNFGALPMIFQGTSPQSLAQLCLVGLVYPSLAAQASWLSAQLAMRRRRLLEGVSIPALVSGTIGIGIASVAVMISMARMSEGQQALTYLAMVPLTVAVTASLTVRIARFPISGDTSPVPD